MVKVWRFYVVINIELNQLVPECLLTDLLAGLTRRSPSELHPVKEKVDQPRETKLIKLVLPAKSFSLSSFTQPCPIISRELNLPQNFTAFLIMVRSESRCCHLMASSTRSTLVHKLVHQKLTVLNSFLSSIHRIIPISCIPECLLADLLAGWLAGYGSLTRRSPSELHPVKEKVDQPRKTKLIKLWCYLPNPSPCLHPNASLWLS